MADLIEVDGLIFNGYPNDSEGFDVSSSTSPYQVAAEFGMEPGERKYTWTDSTYSVGSSQIGASAPSNVERTVPLLIRNRFSSAYTNLVTNPRPYSVVTGWQAEGTGSTVTYASVATENVIQAVTTGSANSGLETTFTGTVAAYSGGLWVKVNSGTAPIDVKFDGETGTSITATTEWQFVKTENKTLTAAGRSLQAVQTDTGSRTIYVKLAGVVLNSTYPGYIDGACGDAVWNGTAHASTSTAKTGEDAILRAFGLIGEKGEKVTYEAPQGGVTLYWQAAGATYRSAIDCRALDVTGLTYDRPHAVADGSGKRIAMCEVRFVCHPHVKGPQYTAGTFYKASGVPALTCNITDVKGHVRGPAEVRFTGGTVSDQRLAIYGIQGRDFVSGSSLVVRGPDMGTAGYSGSIVAHTNEVQTITQTGTITAGSFALSLDAVSATAANAVYNVGTADLDTYIETIPNIGSGGVTVSGGPLPGTAGTITFGGTLAGCNVSPLVVDNSGLTGGSYTIATVTPGTAGYVTASLYDAATTICDSGNLSLVGDYQMWARVYDNSSTSDLYKSRLRARWNVGDGDFETNDWATPQAVGDYALVDLGQVHIDEIPTGTQRAKVLIDGKTSGTAGSTVRVVDLYFYPAETGLGEVRSVSTNDSTLSMLDNFGATSGALTGDTATSGQTWASIGGSVSATDFTETAAPDNAVIRTADNDNSTDLRRGRGVVLGSGTPTDVRVGVDCATATVVSAQGVIARFTDANNFVFGGLSWVLSPPSVRIGYYLVKVVAGTVSTVAYTAQTLPDTSGTRRVELTVRDSGLVSLAVDGISRVNAHDAVFATGGALASGKSGILDWAISGGTGTRTYSDFRVSIPTAESIALYRSQDLQFRQNEILREASGGGVYGTPFQNSQPFQPELTPEGSEGITNRLLLGTSRFNPDLASHPHPDAFTATIHHTPVYVLGRDES